MSSKIVNIITNPVPKPKHGTVVVDWSPRICGATAWCGHLLGADPNIELMSFSKSGRRLATWESPLDWQARRISDAAAILNDYDRVVLGDIACFAPDVTLDAAGRPYYEEVMGRVTRRWTGIFHGGTYPTKHDVTIDTVLSSPGFCGTLLTPRLGQARERLAQWPGLRFVHTPYLPYDVSQAPQRRGSRGRTRDVLMTARLMSNKGQNAALALADSLVGDTHVWGYDPFGFPSIGWSLWELGTLGLGYTQVEYPSLRKDKLSLTHPNAHHHYTGKFALRTPTGRTYRYHDGYLKLDEIDWSPWLHVSLASNAFAGILEYTIIDAVMSGSIVAVPASFPAEGKYETVITFPFDGSTIGWDNTKKRVRDRHPFDRRAVAKVINDHLRLPVRGLEEIADSQYREFLKLHDPRRTLNAINKALKGSDSMVSFTRSPAPPAAPKTTQKKPGSLSPDPGEKSGAFIRRCLTAGMDGDAILEIVHANFPGSKAGKSDINWNRQKLKNDGAAPTAAAALVDRVNRQTKPRSASPPFDGGKTQKPNVVQQLQEIKTKLNELRDLVVEIINDHK